MARVKEQLPAISSPILPLEQSSPLPPAVRDVDAGAGAAAVAAVTHTSAHAGLAAVAVTPCV